MDVVELETTDAKGGKVNFSTPRCVKVVAKPRPMTWQVQQGLGLSGAFARFTGIGLASGTITLTMTTLEHRVEFDSECKIHLAAPAQGQPAKVFTVKHPRFARIGMDKLHFQGEPAGEWDEQKQIETVVYEWEESRRPLPMLSSAPTTAGSTKDGPKAKSEVNAAIKATVKQNSDTIAALSKGLAAP